MTAAALHIPVMCPCVAQENYILANILEENAGLLDKLLTSDFKNKRKKLSFFFPEEKTCCYS